jgi:hypothetical protein
MDLRPPNGATPNRNLQARWGAHQFVTDREFGASVGIATVAIVITAIVITGIGGIFSCFSF